MTDLADAMIVGGGPAGAALAIYLARAGRAVMLLERRDGPHDKVCGEFLSGEAVQALAALGLDLHSLGAAPIRRVRLAGGRDVVESALPFAALSLSRRRLDAALLDAATMAGVQVRRAFRVTALQREADGWRALGPDDEPALGRQAFLAVGKHDLRGHKRGAGLHGDLVAFKMHWRLAPDQGAALDGAVELGLFDGGYFGLEPIEDGKANLCFVIARKRLAELGTWPDALAAVRAGCRLLDQRLAGAQALWAKPLALAHIPYGHVARPSDGPWRLGDQAAVIPSFAGDGVAIALHSAALAARLYLDGKDGPAYARALAHDLGLRVRVASLLSHAMVRPSAQRALIAAVKARPQLITATARLTRIPPAALKRAEAGGAPIGCTRRPAPG